MRKGLCLGFFALVTLFAGNTPSVEAGNPIVRTDKVMYMLDPYYWVYSAADYHYWWPGAVDPDVWQDGGHAVTVQFTVTGYSGTSQLIYSVAGLTTEKGGTLDGDFKGSFEVNEDDVGGAGFKPGEKDGTGASVVPKALTLTVKDAVTGDPVVARTIKINRWGCDRCHLDIEIAKEIYSWCNPTGGPQGPHTWPQIMGRNNQRPGFTYQNLTDPTLTHTPTVQGVLNGLPMANPLDRPPYHEMTNVKQCGNIECAPCHQGYEGTPRVPNFITGWDGYDQRGKSLTVQCVFCHGMEGGYVPDSMARPLWEDWRMDSWQ